MTKDESANSAMEDGIPPRGVHNLPAGFWANDRGNNYLTDGERGAPGVVPVRL